MRHEPTSRAPLRSTNSHTRPKFSLTLKSPHFRWSHQNTRSVRNRRHNHDPVLKLVPVSPLTQPNAAITKPNQQWCEPTLSLPVVNRPLPPSVPYEADAARAVEPQDIRARTSTLS